MRCAHTPRVLPVGDNTRHAGLLGWNEQHFTWAIDRVAVLCDYFRDGVAKSAKSGQNEEAPCLPN